LRRALRRRLSPPFPREVARPATETASPKLSTTISRRRQPLPRHRRPPAPCPLRPRRRAVTAPSSRLPSRCLLRRPLPFSRWLVTTSMLMRTDTAAGDLIVRARRILALVTTEELVLLAARLMWFLMVLLARLLRMPSL
ncbi:hypothetical protein N0V92_007698, partial [Colletotrichum tropicale]